MAERIAWTRDQQLIALRLYARTPFGKLHGKNPQIMFRVRLHRTIQGALQPNCPQFQQRDFLKITHISRNKCRVMGERNRSDPWWLDDLSFP